MEYTLWKPECRWWYIIINCLQPCFITFHNDTWHTSLCSILPDCSLSFLWVGDNFASLISSYPLVPLFCLAHKLLEICADDLSQKQETWYSVYGRCYVCIYLIKRVTRSKDGIRKLVLGTRVWDLGATHIQFACPSRFQKPYLVHCCYENL
jgi:hypothetical protein